jgi:hypothetical protein
VQDDEHPPTEAAASLERAERASRVGCVIAALLGLAALGGLGSIGANHAVASKQSETDEVLAQLSADGLGISAEELAGPPVPQGDVDRIWRVLKAVEGLSEMEKGSLELYRIQAFVRGKPQLSLLPEENDLLRDRQAWARELKAALEALQGIGKDLDASLGKTLAFNLDWSKGFTLQLPHLMPLRSLVTVLCGRALYRHQKGESRLGWTDMARALEVTLHYREPTLISGLVRMAMVDTAANSVVRMLRHGPPPEGPLGDRIEAALVALDNPDDVTYAFRGELLCGTQGLPDADQALPDLAALFGESSMSFVYKVPVFGRLSYSSDRAEYVRLLAQAVRISRQPAHQALKALQAMVEGVEDKGTFAVMLLPALGKVVERFLSQAARLRMARTAILLTRQTGPKGELSELLPDPLLGDPTSDSSSPIRWQVDGPRRGRLWCAGNNRRDDGGQILTENAPLDIVVELILSGAKELPRDAKEDEPSPEESQPEFQPDPQPDSQPEAD